MQRSARPGDGTCQGGSRCVEAHDAGSKEEAAGQAVAAPTCRLPSRKKAARALGLSRVRIRQYRRDRDRKRTQQQEKKGPPTPSAPVLPDYLAASGVAEDQPDPEQQADDDRQSNFASEKGDGCACEHTDAGCRLARTRRPTCRPALGPGD